MRSLRRSDLVAVVLPPGPEWPGVLAAAWDAGAAVLPVDDRLPPAEARRLLRAARPTVVVDAEGFSRRSGGVPVEGDDEDPVALVVGTSGTTGAPKLAELTLEAVRAAAAAGAERVGATPEDEWLACLPLAHVGGLMVVVRALLLGAPLTVHRSFDAAAFEAAASARFTSLVPTMLARLVDRGADLARFRAILVGGGTVPDALVHEAAGARLVRTYGSTETCGGVVYDGIPLDGVEVRIGADDEIQVRGPTLFRGYRLDPASTARAFTPDAWLATRDAGALEDGRLRVRGRLDERIRTGGETVWPQEVEAVLREHPGVAEALVAGSPDPEWGERVAAYVVPADATDPPTLDALRAHAAGRLAKHKLPRELLLVDRLPATRLGKPRRRGETRDQVASSRGSHRG